MAIGELAAGFCFWVCVLRLPLLGLVSKDIKRTCIHQIEVLNYIVDGFYIAELLRNESQESYDLLSNTTSWMGAKGGGSMKIASPGPLKGKPKGGGVKGFETCSDWCAFVVGGPPKIVVFLLVSLQDHQTTGTFKKTNPNRVGPTLLISMDIL